MDLRRVVDSQFVQLLPCEDESNDFQATYMSAGKQELIFNFYISYGVVIEEH